MRLRPSSTKTFAPWLSKSAAAFSPESPAPTTITSRRASAARAREAAAPRATAPPAAKRVRRFRSGRICTANVVSERPHA